MSAAAVFFVAFLACAVEFVEAATIVLAIELTRGRKSALAGCIFALVLLVALVAIAHPLLGNIPLSPLRLIVGIVALWFGFNWLRKAVLRAAGVKALHDEAAIFEAQTKVTSSEAFDRRAGIDRLGFVVSFKAVLLEGFEAVVIVITVGEAHQHMVGAVCGAAVALVVVTAAAIVLHKPLTRVPENAMKMTVGVMLVSFGSFWALEGAGLRWPGGDAAIAVLILVYALVATGCVRVIGAKAQL